MEFWKRINDNKTKGIEIFFLFEDQMGSSWGGRAVAENGDFYRERRLILSRIPADRTIGFRQSKKESCSTRRGLRVDTDLVEF